MRCGSTSSSWQTVATTTGTTVTVLPPPGTSDYAVWAIMPDGTSKIRPLRVTVIW